MFSTPPPPTAPTRTKFVIYVKIINILRICKFSSEALDGHHIQHVVNITSSNCVTVFSSTSTEAIMSMLGDVRSWYGYSGLIFQSSRPIQMFADNKKGEGKRQWTMLDGNESPTPNVLGLTTLYNAVLSSLNYKIDHEHTSIRIIINLALFQKMTFLVCSYSLWCNKTRIQAKLNIYYMNIYYVYYMCYFTYSFIHLIILDLEMKNTI